MRNMFLFLLPRRSVSQSVRRVFDANFVRGEKIYNDDVDVGGGGDRQTGEESHAHLLPLACANLVT